jgi:hypothetical protein
MSSKKIKNGYGELRSAYLVDCKPPYLCGGEEYLNLIEKWELCERFKLLWWKI